MAASNFLRTRRTTAQELVAEKAFSQGDVAPVIGVGELLKSVAFEQDDLVPWALSVWVFA